MILKELISKLTEFSKENNCSDLEVFAPNCIVPPHFYLNVVQDYENSSGEKRSCVIIDYEEPWFSIARKTS